MVAAAAARMKLEFAAFLVNQRLPDLAARMTVIEGGNLMEASVASGKARGQTSSSADESRGKFHHELGRRRDFPGRFDSSHVENGRGQGQPVSHVFKRAALPQYFRVPLVLVHNPAPGNDPC